MPCRPGEADLSAAGDAASSPSIRFNPSIGIAVDRTVTVVVGRSEMGQGVATAQSMLVDEEFNVPLHLGRKRNLFVPAGPFRPSAPSIRVNPALGRRKAARD
jgi:hypothetical protein